MGITNKFSIPVFMILCMFPFQLSQATDTLLPNQMIRDGQSLISANKTFELGFFSPGSSSNRYVGIWYHKLPTPIVVWVANRDRPLLDSSGYFTIDEQGNLMILDSIGASIIVGPNTGKTNLTCATLLDSGNLVLREMNGSGIAPVSWQSFDNPTDTNLPNMKLGLDGRVNRLITSWRSSDDPGLGDFSFGADPNGTEQLFIWQRGQVFWRSGIWNGTQFSLAPEIKAYYYYKNFSYIPDWSDGHFSYSFQDPSIVSMAKLDPSGQIKHSGWTDDQWVVYWAQPQMFLCEVPNYCGPNGICNNSTSPTCKCPFRFRPNSLTDWESGKWTGGCARQTPLQCASSDGFFKLENVKLPIFFSREGDSSMGLENCKANCAKNCNCTAYASENANGTGCLIWSRDLLGLKENITGAQDLYVRLLASELEQISDQKTDRVQLVIIISAIVSAIFLLLIISVCFFMRKFTRGNSETNQDLLPIGLSSHPGLPNSFLDTIKNGKGEKGPVCSFINFTDIATSTDNFSASNKLGEGGFGPVYMGTLEGRTIAVKRLSKGSGQGIIEFSNEINLIANLQHTNLVRLLGFCVEGEEKILIYEYMANKSLDLYLFDGTKLLQLDWQKRFHIIEGIAQGLLYLHKYSRLRIIHRDLKTSNVLLDDEMNPKISDFGLARIFGQNENQANTKRVIGTYGYMSPEYAMDGLFSTKSDVFSFGVIMLEIVSGKKAPNFELSGKAASLPGYAWELWKEGRGLELIDPSLADDDRLDEVSRCIHVALLCVQERAEDRPHMSDVVPLLCSEAATLSKPAQPAFCIVRTSPSPDYKNMCTSNDVTLTAVEGR